MPEDQSATFSADFGETEQITRGRKVLPDLPSLKQDIQRLIDRYLHSQVHARLGVFDQSPKHIVHEGNRMRVIRADGSIDETDPQQASSEMLLKMDEVPSMSVQQRVKKLDEMAEDMARQMSEHLYGALSAGLNKAGQVVNRNGVPFDIEVLFEVLEKIQLEFDESGKHNQISVVIPPALASRVKEVFEQITSDPQLKVRHEEIILKKKLEWRDREAARKLVG